MYGWIAERISSIFEPVTGHSNPDWPGNGEQRPGGTVVTAGPHRAHSHPRPAKRSYQSVHVSNGAAQGEQREAKRRKLDVVLSFVKRTVARVAGLFRLGRGQNTDCEQYRRHEESKNQPVTLMGIHEIRTSWLTGSEWRMDKSSGGAMERDRPGRSSLPSSSPLSIRSGAVLCGGGPDGGRDRGAALPSRSALGVGLGAPSPGAELPHLCFGHSRCYKPSLTVEEAIKQSDKERYRRLLEMVVTEKYSKTQPLPFSRTTPADATPASNDGRPGRFAKPLDSGPWRTASISATPNAFSWRNAAAAAASHARDWRPGGVFTKALGGASGDKLPRGLKQGHAPQEDLSAEVASRLSLLDRETPAPGRHADPTVTPAFGEHDLPRLTTVMAGEVSAALNQADPSLVLSAAFKLRITQRDLSTLREGSWLNDEVINFYLSLVTERSARQDPPGPRVYCFSTFFLPKLRGGAGGGGHQAVRRWTKAVDLFLQDLVLVPLHLDTHWALAVIDLRSQTVRSYDSMGQRHDDICSMLLMFLTEEHRVKKGRELDASRWTLGSLRPSEIPQQKNGSDCGVFACKYADYVSRGRPLTFRQCHMPLFRKAMVWEILNKKLL